jgi:TRAP transporter TAXI family solute receptor
MKSGTSRSFLVMYGVALALAAAGFLVAWRFVGQPPPRSFRFAAGAKGGAYYAFAQRYATFLEARGIRMEVVETAGSVENLRLLQDPRSGVAAGLVQGGVADAAGLEALVGLGSVCFEPLWVFTRAEQDVRLPADLRGRCLAIGPEGSGTRPLALRILAANGLDARNTRLEPLSGTNAAAALVEGRLDALFAVSSVDGGVVRQLLLDDRVAVLDFAQAEAYARRFRTLSAVRLPAGIADFGRNRPAADVRLVSPAAAIVARETLHPALVDLLLQAAASVHGGGDLLSEPGTFPSPRYVDVPLGKDAQRYFKYGPPFLQRFLPFWMATTIDRIKVMVVPLLVLLLPLLKIVPPTFRWRMRGKIVRWYRQLHGVDDGIEKCDQAALDERLLEIDRVEREVLRISVPLGFADQLYNLRGHIELVRGRVASRRALLSKKD